MVPLLKFLMISTIFWNIRGVRSNKGIHRLKQLIDINCILFVAIMEPMVSKERIEGYRKFLGFKECVSNDNGKIWCFWKNVNQATVIANEEQQISIKMDDGRTNPSVFITAVYAKCTSRERKDLWCNLEDISLAIDGPWCIGGDFNVILEPDEKLGGMPHRMYKSLDFQMCMDNCGVTDIGFFGAKYT